MVEFVLNNELIRTHKPGEYLLLDFLREEKHLKGTKSACREGDCGSCSVIIGEFRDNDISYKATTSCLTPIGNINGKHVVTIEGINMEHPTKIQKGIVEAAATQCGYCTPGIILSLTAYFLSQHELKYEDALDSVAGNICRCTGYQSIINAIENIIDEAGGGSSLNLESLIENEYIPAYFTEVAGKLQNIDKLKVDCEGELIGGGTDIYVQNSEFRSKTKTRFIKNEDAFTNIHQLGDRITIGAAVTLSELFSNKFLKKRIPDLRKVEKLIASILIRNVATVGGNLVNASPIGDLSILFLALNATVELEHSNKKIREIKLVDFFKSYKEVDLNEGEILKSINIEKTVKEFKFNFEKISKRKHLDIATVNSAIQIYVENNLIKEIHLSMGGVTPIPKYLSDTCKVLTGGELIPNNVKNAAKVLEKEISPISDVRGSAEYKRLLARQLFFAHFVELFPETFNIEELL